MTDRKSTRLNSSHLVISYAVFCLKKKKKNRKVTSRHLTNSVTCFLCIERSSPACVICAQPVVRQRHVRRVLMRLCFFFFNDTATTEIYTLSLHDALPI